MKQELTIIGLIAVLVIGGWVLVDNAAYFDMFNGGLFAEKAGAQETATLNVSVAETFTFTLLSGSTIQFGAISSDQRFSDHETTFSVDTNSATGWSVTGGRDRASATLVSDSDPGNTFIDDSGAAGPEPASDVPSCTAATWPTTNVSRGLGFSVFSASPAGIKDSCWGTGNVTNDINNAYAALATSASPTKIIRNASQNTNTQLFSVGYNLEIRSSQGATDYTGEIIYTGTASP